MNKKLTTLLALALLALPALADVFPIHTFYEGDSYLKARDKASGQPLWQAKIRATKTTINGQPFLYTVEEGKGQYGQDKKEKSWRTESYTAIKGDQAIPYQVKQVFKDPAGKVISSLQKDYDLKDKAVNCRINGQTKSYEFKPDLIDRETLGLCLRNFAFGSSREFPFHLLTNEPSLYHMSIKYLGRETLVVDGVAYDCHKVQMLLDLGAINILSGFFPKTYFWFRAAEPHDMLRYEGLESALGTPYLVLEINKGGK
jgi:hypothetical protein